MSRYFQIGWAVNQLKKGRALTFNGLIQADGNTRFWIEYPHLFSKDGKHFRSGPELVMVSRKTGLLARQPLELRPEEIIKGRWDLSPWCINEFNEALDRARRIGMSLEEWKNLWFGPEWPEKFHINTQGKSL